MSDIHLTIQTKLFRQFVKVVWDHGDLWLKPNHDAPPTLVAHARDRLLVYGQPIPWDSEPTPENRAFKIPQREANWGIGNSFIANRPTTLSIDVTGPTWTVTNQRTFDQRQGRSSYGHILLPENRPQPMGMVDTRDQVMKLIKDTHHYPYGLVASVDDGHRLTAILLPPPPIETRDRPRQITRSQRETQRVFQRLVRVNDP